MCSDLELERTWDLDLVKATLTHPRIWRHISDDQAPAAEEFRPLSGNAVHYLAVTFRGEYMGLFLFAHQTGICWEVHTALLPEAWGAVAAAAAIAAQHWIWEHTPCRRIVTTVPIYNQLARRFAEAAGLEPYGCNPSSIEHRGQLWDQDLLGISRPEEGKETKPCLQLSQFQPL